MIGYWSQDETYDDAVDYDVSIFEMAADFIKQTLHKHTSQVIVGTYIHKDSINVNGIDIL